MISALFLVVLLGGSLAAAGALLYLLLSEKGLRGLRDGQYWDKRLKRLEAEVKRLSDQDTRLGLDDEVRRLDEKVEFLEALLADRPNAGALPPGDMDDSGGDKQRAD